MANWCSTAYVIDGDTKEVKNLYELMKGLQEQKEPSAKNGFGTTWLGYLVDAISEDRNRVSCWGNWNDLKMIDNTLRFTTETAWGPCNEIFDLVCEKFPSLCYYFRAEEPCIGIYETNDEEYKYFTDKYSVSIRTSEGKSYREYFTDLSSLFARLEELSGQPVRSEGELEELMEQWCKRDTRFCCHIAEFEIVE